MMTATEYWRDLESRFQTLHRADIHCLTAQWISTFWIEPGEHWRISYRGINPPNLSIRNHFRVLAESAAVRLGHAAESTAESFWLDEMRRDSPNYQGGGVYEGVHGKAEWGFMEFVCGASASFCLKCETRELLNGRPSPSAPSSMRAEDASVSRFEAPFFHRESAASGDLNAATRPETSGVAADVHDNPVSAPSSEVKCSVAVCPPILLRLCSLSPKFFASYAEAKEWQGRVNPMKPGSEVTLVPGPNRSLRFMRQISLEEQGWGPIVPVRSLADYAPGPAYRESIQEYLPLQLKHSPEPANVEEAIDDFSEERTAEIRCSLGEDWNFAGIRIAPTIRSGLINLVSDMRFTGVVFKFAKKIEHALNIKFPELPPAAYADFWQSWEVHKHIAEFCYELGVHRNAVQFAGDQYTAETEARKARSLVATQIAALAQSAASAVGSKKNQSKASETVLQPADQSLPQDSSKAVSIHESLQLESENSKAGGTVEESRSLPNGENSAGGTKGRKGDAAILANKDAVVFRTAETYLGMTDRQRHKLVQRGVLIIHGKGSNRKITTASLLAYLPPEKRRTDPN